MEENKESKVSIYKKWWFWFIIIIAFITIIGISNDDTSKTKNTLSNGTDTNTTNVAYSSNSQTSSNDTETVEVKKAEVTVPDFSKISQKEVKKWCNKHNIECDIHYEYSSKIKSDKFINQSVKANKTIYEGDKITVTYSLGKEPTLGEKNALSSAKDYLDSMAFSYKGLIKQLKYEGYSTSEATYAADNCDADWNEQAAKAAKDYINSMSFSKSGLIRQLEYEGYTKKQAQYGAKAVGY